MTRTGSAHLSEETLLDLVHGLLDADARSAALDHAGSCVYCEERLRELSGEAVRVGLEAPTRAAIAKDARRAPASTTTGRRIPGIWLGAAAAAAVIVVVAVFKIARPGADPLDYWLPVDAEQVMLRSVPAHEDQPLFLEAVLAYRGHDSARVVALLEKSDIPAEYEPLRLLLASALVHEGRYAEARDRLDRMDIPTLPQPWRDRARWTLYVALLRGGDGAAAERILRDLASRPGEFRDRALRVIPSPERPPG